MKSVPLGDLCSYVNGGTPSKSEPSYWNGPHAWITSTEIQNGALLPARSTVTDTGIANSSTSLVPSGTLLLVTRTGVGKVATSTTPVCFSQDITAIIPDKSRLNTSYLSWFLRGKTDYFVRSSRGATIKGITRDVINRLEILLPPLSEQKRIAGILDAADALRAKRREALAQLDTLLQSTFLDMFGDPVTNPKGWDVRQLKESGVEVKVGPFGSLLHKADYIPGGIPLINPKHIVDGSIEHSGDESVSTSKANELQEYLLKEGDVLLARRGEMGRCVIIRAAHENWLCGTGSVIVRVTSNLYDPEFLAAAFGSQQMRKHLENLSGGAIMPSLSGTQIKTLPLLVPPRSKQNEFSLFIKLLKAQKSRMQAHLAELDALFASLQSRAFNGEL